MYIEEYNNIKCPFCRNADNTVIVYRNKLHKFLSKIKFFNQVTCETLKCKCKKCNIVFETLKEYDS